MPNIFGHSENKLVMVNLHTLITLQALFCRTRTTIQFLNFVKCYNSSFMFNLSSWNTNRMRWKGEICNTNDNLNMYMSVQKQRCILNWMTFVMRKNHVLVLVLVFCNCWILGVLTGKCDFGVINWRNRACMVLGAYWLVCTSHFWEATISK